MPHLAPLAWMSVPILFYFLLVFMISVLWWHSNPSWPSTPKNMPLPFRTWAWK